MPCHAWPQGDAQGGRRRLGRWRGGGGGGALDWFLGEKQAAAWRAVPALGGEGCGSHEGGVGVRAGLYTNSGVQPFPISGS